MKYITTDGKNKDFVELCSTLDSALDNASKGEEIGCKYDLLNKLDGINDAIIVYDNQKAIGCASYKKYDEDTVEIKRVFVDNSYRRRGIANELMQKIQNMAKSNGYKKACLETGRHMKGAVALYRNLGYKEIPNYGEYAHLPQSICFEKEL